MLNQQARIAQEMSWTVLRRFRCAGSAESCLGLVSTLRIFFVFCEGGGTLFGIKPRPIQDN
jgi:hypothetical protein